MITLLEIAIIIILLPQFLLFIKESNVPVLLLKSCLILYILWFPVSAQLDARSRFQNYKQLKDQIYLNGYQERILKPVLKSRCQRDAAKVAANELGYIKECTQYFKSYGYRWYHLIPDWFFRKPHFLLSKYFFRTTFFAQYYNPRVDYKAICQNPGRHDHLTFIYGKAS
ncbi:MAG: hypothetical protein U9R60_00620 [Bacteroidota bacterium]|nr:hypothetical protein [Bacteroidota bacterium]